VKDNHLGTGEYDPKSYWDARAKTSRRNIYDAVCCYGLSNAENWAMERVQLATLRSFLSHLNPRSKVLEIGCGLGRWTPVIINLDMCYNGVDISEEMLRIARARVSGTSSFYKATSNKLPFSDNLYDLVFSIAVIHHNPYDQHEKIIMEMVRVTKPNGFILIMEGIGQSHTSFNMFPRPIESWITLFEKQGIELIRMRPQSWWVFRNYVIYFPLRVLRKLTGKPTKIETPLDKALAILTGYLDPYLIPFLPRRFASNVALMFKKRLKS